LLLITFFEEAREKLPNVADQFVGSVKEYISEIVNKLFKLCLDLIPTNITAKGGEYELQNVLFSQEFSLTGGLEASLTELLEFVAGEG